MVTAHSEVWARTSDVSDGRQIFTACRDQRERSFRSPPRDNRYYMRATKLGSLGLEVSAQGLGCMGMSGLPYGVRDNDAESIATIHRAIDLGVSFFDTADMWEPYTNEELLGRAIKEPAIARGDCPQNSALCAIRRALVPARYAAAPSMSARLAKEA